jgi:hypothetical protein
MHNNLFSSGGGFVARRRISAIAPGWAAKNSEMEVVCMKVVSQQVTNATPHEVKIKVESQEVVIPSSGQALRLPEVDRTVGTVVIEGVEVPLVARSWSLPELPETSEKTVMVVSLPFLMSLNAIPEEKLPSDVLFVAPDTGKGAIRNANGQIEATKQLITTEKLLSKFIGAEGTETTVRIWFFPAAGDEISLSAVSIQVRSRETAARIASLLDFAGLTVVVEDTEKGESFANFSSSRHRPLAEFVQDYKHWWERE